MDAPPTQERAGWRRFLTPRVTRILAAVGVVAAAAVIVPTLTSEPRRDEEAVRTAEASARTSTTAEFGRTTDAASLELPSELTTVPATDGPRATEGTTTTRAPSTTKATTPTTSPPAEPTSTTPPATTPTTAATEPPASCGGGGSAELSCLFDNYRRAQGLPGMTRTAAMNQRAQAWADKMASEATMSHSDLNLIFQSCGGCTAVAENVGFNGSAAAAWQGWLNSATHLNNIRTPKGGVYGMGATRSADGTLWVVQMFGFS
jgi:uncharacterized protein YkwD